MSSIQMAHGGGGRMMHRLLEEVIWPAFGNPLLDARHDGAVLPKADGPLAFSTDSYVVRPPFFPGGDIGSLAVYGTVNDLAMCGARPAWLSAAFILEEGFAIADFARVVRSMAEAARVADVRVVTGDLKVVDRGKGDGIYVNTAGVGILADGRVLGPREVRPGDAVIVSGDVGRHGIAVLSARESLGFESTLRSDSAPLHEAVAALLQAGIEVRCLRDLTRGGLATALIEIAETAGVEIDLDEERVLLTDEVRAACEVLGLDPFYVACEGRFAAFVAAHQAEKAVDVLRGHEISVGAAVVGRVTAKGAGRVVGRTGLGTSRLIEMFSGDQLPRIC